MVPFKPFKQLKLVTYLTSEYDLFYSNVNVVLIANLNIFTIYIYIYLLNDKLNPKNEIK